MGDHKIGAEFSAAPNHKVRRIPSLVYKDNPDTLFTFGVDYHFSINPEWPAWLKQTGPWASLFYSYLPEGESTRYSNRHEVGFLVGYQQYISPYFFLLAATGLGAAFNRFNFGGGALPELEKSLNANFNVRAGTEYCVQSDFCVSLFGGFQGERSIAGQPHYYNQGWYVGLALNLIIPQPEKPHPPVDVVLD